MKAILLMPVLFSSSALAEEICRQFEPHLTDRWRDAIFTQAAATKAADYLRSFVVRDDGTDPWYHFKVIEGYLLKRNAEQELKMEKNGTAYHQYCLFVTQPGVHRDS